MMLKMMLKEKNDTVRDIREQTRLQRVVDQQAE